MHSNLAVFFVPVAEQLPADADAHTSSNAPKCVMLDVIPLKANQLAIAINTPKDLPRDTVCVRRIGVALFCKLISRRYGNA